MVPTTRTHLYTRFNGSLPIGGTPSEPTYFDEEVKATQHCLSTHGVYTTTLHDPETGDGVNMRSTAPYRYMQVWTGAMSTFGIDAIVLEPLSAMSDGFNNHDGLHIISPGQSFTATVHVALA